MKQFAELFLELDRTNKTSRKTELLKNYFLTAPEEDRIWALALFTGRRPRFNVNRSQIWQWAGEESGIPEWLLRESYSSVGDLGETISLVLPERVDDTDEKTLSDWFSLLNQLPAMNEQAKKETIISSWKQLTQHEKFVFNKLIMGSFRIGVSQSLVIRAIAEATGKDLNIIAHRLMGKWSPIDTRYDELIMEDGQNDESSKPYPFFLAYPVSTPLEELGNSEDWFAEWKWDGIRAQIILRNDEIFIWSRGEDLATDKFPELHILKKYFPGGTVLDGEIVCYMNNSVMPFNVLQTRIGRKNLTKNILKEAPVNYIVYDILEYGGEDIRGWSQKQRREKLEELVTAIGVNDYLRISPLVTFNTWDELREWHGRSREFAAEGFMLKNKNGIYQVGRKVGGWLKWKVNPYSVDAVLVYAAKGQGRRTELYTDYTFAVWDDEKKLIPFAKAYSGLTDKEIAEVDRFVKQHTIEKFGPVRTVKPEMVFEIGFEGINASNRHKSGIAVRFPRILNWRKDKPIEEADTLENLRLLLEGTQRR